MPQPRHAYCAFGVEIASTIACPELLPGSGEPQVRITEGPVPDSLPDPGRLQGAVFEATPSEFLFRIDGVARFLVSNGNEIRIARAQGATDEEVRLFLLGTPIGALLHQRGVVPLHASAVAVDGGCVAFLGPSGSGKSTLAAAFHDRGYPILADDICAIQEGPDGVPMAAPGLTQLKLWADAMEHLRGAGSEAPRVRPALDKFRTPAKKIAAKSLPLRRAYALKPSNRAGIELRPVSGARKLAVFVNNTYRRRFMTEDVRRSHFARCAAAARGAAVCEVRRPQGPLAIDALASALQQDLGA